MLKLLKGDIHRFEPDHNLFQKIRFESYDLKLELAGAMKAFSGRNSKTGKHRSKI